MSPVTAATRVSVRNILWPTDFSACADAALPYAIAIARRYDSRICAVHVITPSAYEFQPPETVADGIREMQRLAGEALSEAAGSRLLDGIEHQAFLVEGNLDDVLMVMVREQKIDLVVLGTHGRTGINKFLLGSAAELILHLAPCPVLTVGPKVTVPAGAEPQPILYATDFHPASLHALPYAISLAEEAESRLILLHVIETYTVPVDIPHHRQHVEMRLRELVPPDARLQYEPEFQVEFGPAAGNILRVAAAHDAHLIVLGAREAGAFPRAATHLPGLRCYPVVTQARCPVLTVRGPR